MGICKSSYREQEGNERVCYTQADSRRHKATHLKLKVDVSIGMKAKDCRSLLDRQGAYVLQACIQAASRGWHCVACFRHKGRPAHHVKFTSPLNGWHQVALHRTLQSGAAHVTLAHQETIMGSSLSAVAALHKGSAGRHVQLLSTLHARGIRDLQEELTQTGDCLHTQAIRALWHCSPSEATCLHS